MRRTPGSRATQVARPLHFASLAPRKMDMLGRRQHAQLLRDGADEPPSHQVRHIYTCVKIHGASHFYCFNMISAIVAQPLPYCRIFKQTLFCGIFHGWRIFEGFAVAGLITRSFTSTGVVLSFSSRRLFLSAQ